MQDNFLKYLDQMSTAESTELRNGLEQLGITKEQFQNMKNYSEFFSYKRDSTMMRKGQRMWDADTVAAGEKYKHAALMPADEAISRYLANSAEYLAHAEHFDKITKEFMSEFGSFLSTPNKWDSDILLGNAAVEGRTARDAYYIQAQLRRIEGSTGYMDKILDSWAINTVDHLGNTKTGKLLGKGLGNMATKFGFSVPQVSVSKGVASSKGFGAQVKLGMMNLSQIPVQGSAMLNVIGYSGVHAVAAMGDVMGLIVPEIIKVGRTKASGKLFKMLDDSGFIAGFDFVGLQHMASGKKTLLGSTALRKLSKFHMLPYTIGDGGVRALAWTAEHRRLLSEIKKGKSTFTMADVGSVKYLNAVSARAMEPALNMSKMNQPLIARGVIGMPGQFQQFAVQQFTFIFGKGMTGMQRARTLGTWGGVFGLSSVPLLHDAVFAAEAGYTSATGDINAIGYFQRAIDGLIDDGYEMVMGETISKETRDFLSTYSKGGVLPALTDNDWTITHRTTMSSYVSDFFNFSSTDDLIFGPAYQTMKQLLTNNVSNISELIQLAKSGDEINSSIIAGMTTKATKGISSLTNLSAAIETVVNDGDFRNVRGQLVAEGTSFSDKIAIGMGFGLGQRQKLWDTKGESKRRQEIIHNELWNAADEIARLSRNQPDTANELFADKILQIGKYNPNLLRSFYSMTARAKIAITAPEAVRDLIYNLNKYNRYFHQQELNNINSGLVSSITGED